METVESINFMTTVFWVLISGILLYFTRKCYKNYIIMRDITKFGGPKGSPILGNLDLILQPRHKLCESLRSLAKEFYPHYALRVLHFTALNIVSPEDAELFLASKKHSSKGDIYLLLQSWLREGLLLAEGEKWFQRRRILTPAFHFNILKDFLDVFNDETERFLKSIQTENSKVIDIIPPISEFALQSINQTAMGHKLNTEDREKREYRHAIYEIGRLFKDRLAVPWQYYPPVYFFSKNFWKERSLLKILHGFTRSIIKERMNNFKTIIGIDDQMNMRQNTIDDVYMRGRKKRFAMLDILLQAKASGEQIDYEGICEEVDTFMFEGHDTTAAALGFCLMLISNHPDIQDQLYREIVSILGHDKKRPSFSDLQKMDLLERCIKESLRLYPSVHLISRKVEEDTTLHCGLTVPRNSMVLIHIFDIHRDPNIYPDAETFDPNRFLSENCHDRHPFAYIPFSAGPRNCIGQKFAMMEMKLFVAGILQQYFLSPVDTPETVVLEIEMLLRAKNGIRMKLIPRI